VAGSVNTAKVYTLCAGCAQIVANGNIMGLSTHVLDIAHGCPAAGMQVMLHRIEAHAAVLLKQVTLNADGRSPEGPLLENAGLKPGNYRLSFAVASYFRAKGVVLPDPPFLNHVSLEFGVAYPQQHYHVPLLVSPYSYSTYRGS
jgi:5-hydroxyisourate hydrolase